MWIVGDTSGIIGSLSGRLACPRGILRRFSDPPLWLAAFCDASCLDVIIPGVLRVPVEVIVIHSGLNSSIFFKGDDLLRTGRTFLFCITRKNQPISGNSYPKSPKVSDEVMVNTTVVVIPSGESAGRGGEDGDRIPTSRCRTQSALQDRLLRKR
jgi:hypothetical protein